MIEDVSCRHVEGWREEGQCDQVFLSTSFRADLGQEVGIGCCFGILREARIGTLRPWYNAEIPELLLNR